MRKRTSYRRITKNGKGLADVWDKTVRNLGIDRTTALPLDTVFTAISNIGTGSISGPFSNLPDGATIIAGPNTLQASYEGGDGNDLTLTVVP